MDFKELTDRLRFWNKKQEDNLIVDLVELAKIEKNPNIIIELAEALIKLEKYEEALDNLKLIAKESNDNPKWNYLMGQCFFLISQEDKNVENLEESLKYLVKAYRLGSREAVPYIEENLLDFLKDENQRLSKEAIKINIGPKLSIKAGESKLGGEPDLPKGFNRPSILKGKEIVELPFLGQFDLEELSYYDQNELLPHEGLLSIFYDSEEESSNANPKLYIFNKKELNNVENRYESYQLSFEKMKTYPEEEDLLTLYPVLENLDLNIESINKLKNIESSSHLLGWPNLNGKNLTDESERIFNKNNNIKKSLNNSVDNWQLLLQLDSNDNETAELGTDTLYFYIRNKDLMKKDLNNVVVFKEKSKQSLS